MLPPAEPDNFGVEGVSNELPRGPELLLGAGVHLGGLVEGVLRGVEGLVPRARGPGECGAVRECSEYWHHLPVSSSSVEIPHESLQI